MGSKVQAANHPSESIEAARQGLGAKKGLFSGNQTWHWKISSNQYIYIYIIWFDVYIYICPGIVRGYPKSPPCLMTPEGS